jgi:hypothetical protein
MDQIKRLSYLMFLTFLSGTFSCTSQKAGVTGSSPVEGLINSQNYMFKADFATPMGGRQILITGPYDLRITKESVVANLPYFGVSQRAPMGSDESGIKFSSTDFTHVVQPKKNGWQIQIKPNDNREVRMLNLRVTTSGRATLQVSSNYKQSISYSGQIIKAIERQK